LCTTTFQKSNCQALMVKISTSLKPLPTATLSTKSGQKYARTVVATSDTRVHYSRHDLLANNLVAENILLVALCVASTDHLTASCCSNTNIHIRTSYPCKELDVYVAVRPIITFSNCIGDEGKCSSDRDPAWSYDVPTSCLIDILLT
jgi:hypothetical protein